MKKILIIGGTLFIGRVLIETLLKEGDKYQITLFNRGKTNPELFPEIRKIHGDRETEDIAKIANEDWDCVIDMCGYYPLTLQKMLQLLKGKIGRYIFISSMSVYPLDKSEGKIITEEFPILACSEAEKIDKTMASYGERKAECERVILAENEIDSIILRPALVYGRYDFTDRMYYWLYRAKFQDKILMPGDGINRLVNTFVDDLAKMIVKAMEVKSHRQVYNASTQTKALSLKEQVTAMTKVLGTNPTWVNAPNDFLEKEGIRQWADIPNWLVGDIMMADASKAMTDLGISFDSFEVSIQKTATYCANLAWQKPRYGISLDKEQELIVKIQT